MYKVQDLNDVLLGAQRKTLIWPVLLIYWKLKTVYLFLICMKDEKCSCFKQMTYHYYCQTRQV